MEGTPAICQIDICLYLTLLKIFPKIPSKNLESKQRCWRFLLNPKPSCSMRSSRLLSPRGSCPCGPPRRHPHPSLEPSRCLFPFLLSHPRAHPPPAWKIPGKQILIVPCKAVQLFSLAPPQGYRYMKMYERPPWKKMVILKVRCSSPGK